jgi:hypothetical protein
MADNTVVHLHAAPGRGADRSRRFSPSDDAEIRRNVAEARAICRALELASAAALDGSVDFEDPAAGRWHPVVDRACECLTAVRSICVETTAAPNPDWWTPLQLLEATGAAMWHCAAPPSCGHGSLEHDEVASLMRVTIASLDRLVEDLKPEGCDA